LSCAIVALAAAPAAALDLTELSLEQLTNAEVYGVSKAQERLLDAPASVSVITAEDIRSFGYRTLADVLNGARGFFTYSDRTYTFVGVRGFAPLGDYNTRVLLLIDGYRANDNFYDQAAIGTDALIDLDLVERVELIRGPSSSIYGTSAFFGVINVVTKSATRLGNAAALGVGSVGERQLRGTLAGRIGDTGSYLLRLSRERNDGLDIVLDDPTGSLPSGGRASGVDGSETRRVFGKATLGAWRVSAAHVQRRKETGYGLYASDFPDPRSFAKDIASFVDARYDRPLGDVTEAALRAFAGRYRYRDRYEYAADPYLGFTDGDWYGVEGQLRHRFSAGHRLIAGVEAQRDARLSQTQTAESLGVLLDDRRSGSRLGVYAQDDYEWSARWSTSAGARYDRYRGGEQVSPRFAVIYKPTRGSSLKLIAGSAFRAPNNYERYYALPGLYLPNPELQAEKIRTFDLDYEAMVGQRTRLALSLFRLRALNLITQVAEPVSGEAQYRNTATAVVRGYDVEVEHAFGAALRLRGVYSYQHAEDGEDRELENSPRHVARVSVLWQLGNGWRLGTEGRYVARRRTFADSVPSQRTANIAVSSPAARTGFDVSFGLYNAFDRRIADPVAPGSLPLDLDRIAQPGRTWQLRVGYGF
jgi:iron complex outermembrane receptor protein